MPYKKGTANNYIDFLLTMHKFLTSAMKFSQPQYYGLNTGNGFISGEWADDSSGVVGDVWTVTIDSGGTTFTVSGADSTHGLQTNTGTIGTRYVSDNEEIGFTLVQGTVPWASGDVITFTTETGIGSTMKWETEEWNRVEDSNIDMTGIEASKGTISPYYDIDSPYDETWTITCTTGGSGGALFSVSGSISGTDLSAWPACQAGIPYDNGIVNFLITVGDAPWEVDDTFSFVVPEKRQVIWKATGNAGTEEIFMGLYTSEDTVPANPIYQFIMNGYTGYNANSDFDNHPNSMDLSLGKANYPRCQFQDRNMDYWLVANGRRVTCFYWVDTVMQCFYMGFLLPYGLPTEIPYPLFIGGTTIWEIPYNYSNTQDIYQHAFYDPSEGYRHDGGYLGGPGRVWDGTTWNSVFNYSSRYIDHSDSLTVSQCVTWPYNAGYGNTNTFWDNLQADSDGGFPMFPIITSRQYPTPVVFGEFEGIYAVPGEGLNSLDISILGTSADPIEYVFFQNVTTSTSDKFAALRIL
jgi:hypothetical protein